MNPLKSLITISSITMFSRILGFVRDTIIARMFGASMMTDAFFVAFKLSNLLRRIFAEGVFYQVFLPILSEYRYHISIKELRAFISHVFGLLIIVLIIIIFIGLLAAPWVIMITAPGFEHAEEKLSVTIVVFRIMFPYILFVSLASLMGAILNVWGRFLVPACTPIFLNISMISFVFLSENLCFDLPIVGLACSVIVGGILQCIYCFPFLKKIDMLIFPKINFFDNRIFKMCRSMSPAVIVVSGVQMSLIINTILASFLQDGSISWMYYADRLIELPVGVFGVTLSTILLSYLSRCISKRNNKDYFDLMNWGIKLCFILGFPSAIILGVLSKPIIVTIFQYGKFSEFDVLMTQYSVIFYAIGLPGLILVKVLTSGFYARRDLEIPVRIVVVVVIFGQFINLSCINALKHVVFALSVSAGAWLNAGLLYWALKKKYFFQLQFKCLFFFFQLAIALFVMYVVCLGILMFIPDWSQGNIIYRLFRMVGALMLCGCSYIITLWCLGMRLKNLKFVSKNNG